VLTVNVCYSYNIVSPCIAQLGDGIKINFELWSIKQHFTFC